MQRSNRADIAKAVSRAAPKRKQATLKRKGVSQRSPMSRRMENGENFCDLLDSIRHLTYHIFPLTNAEESWLWNLEQLAARWHLFNGKKILGINVSSDTERADRVIGVCRSMGMEWDHVIICENNPALGEVQTWIPTLDFLEPDKAQPNEVVFSAHAKGVKYGTCPPLIREWTDMMYRMNLDRWFEVKSQLEWFVATGVGKGRWGSHSAYSGGFWWWRLHDIGKRDWRRVSQIYPGREVWIGTQAESHEMGCLVLDNCRNLYDEKYWNAAVRPRLRSYEADHPPDRNRPHKPIAYLVSSHFSYAPFALPRLLKSMRAAGVKPDQVFVVMCGCVREFDQRTDLGTIWYVNHESRNFGTFVEAVSARRAEALSQFDHVFCLLDTSDVGPRFAELTDSFDRQLDAVGANPHGGEHRAMCDLATYSLDHLRSMKPQIEQFKNAPSRINWEWEGRVFGEAARRSFYGRGLWGNLPAHSGGYEHIGKEVTAGPADVYGTGSLRITEYYKFIDLFRFKSNWGQNPYLLDRV